MYPKKNLYYVLTLFRLHTLAPIRQHIIPCPGIPTYNNCQTQLPDLNLEDLHGRRYISVHSYNDCCSETLHRTGNCCRLGCPLLFDALKNIHARW
jgi:hypothetical protein